MLCCALFVGTSAWAKTEDGEAAAKSEPVSANEEELLNKILSKLPKVSGYIQTGYNYGDKNGDNRSSFQLKRMRVLLDKKISNTFDFRAQFECFRFYRWRGLQKESHYCDGRFCQCSH